MFGEGEQLDFEQATRVEGLDDEIAMLRVRIKSVLRHDPDNIKLIAQATNALARLVSTRCNISKNDKNRLREAINNVLKDVALPLGIGFNLIAAINSGRLKMYAGDGSAEYRQFWFEMEKAKSQFRPNKTINFYVDSSEGHDDFLMSLALLIEASQKYSPRSAKGTLRL